MERKLDKLVHVNGTWWLAGNQTTMFYGHIFRSGEDYHFICHTMTRDIYNDLQQAMPVEAFNGDACLNGLVRGQFVSLIGCRIGTTSYNSDGNKSENLVFEIEIVPNEIVYGEYPADTATLVTKASVDYLQMDEFINLSAIDGGIDGTKLVPDKAETINNAEFSLLLYPVGTFSFSRNMHKYESMVKTDFLFHTPILLEDARSHIAKFRLLLSIFKLNIITVANIEMSIDLNGEGGCCIYHMNSVNDRIDEIWPVPFFSINYEDISDVFGDIVDNWLIMFADAEPIMELFYQTLTRKSYDVNKFLNLAQAIEVYSNKYRKCSVKEVYNRFPNDNPCDTSVKMFHKMYDLMELFAPCTGLCAEKNEILSKMITDTRNYFTHYGSNSKKKALTGFGERNAVANLMFYVLAFAIYYKLGISIEVIKKGFRHSLYDNTLKRVDNLFPKNDEL